MIFAIANTKGGVGKTDTSIHLGAALAKLGSTLLIDADPSAQSAQWAEFRSEHDNLEASPVTVRLRGKAVLEEGRKLAQNYEHTVIDVGGWDNPGLRAALMIADRIVIPMSVSGADGLHMDKMQSILEETSIYNPDAQAAVLITKVSTQARDDNEAREFLEDYDIAIFDAFIYERKSHRRAFIEGLTVGEMKTDKSAAKEVEAFIKEALS